MTEPHLWLKALHLVSVIAWMAGLLYLPRLFVYHAEAEPGSDKSETFKVMERRLLRGILNPAMLATWGFGLALALWSGFYREPWLMTKVVLVVVLTGLHMAMARWRRDFAADRKSAV